MSQAKGILQRILFEECPLHHIEVCYNPRQDSNPISSSPSPGKPKWVVEHWLAQGLPINVQAPAPATMEQLALAHPPDFVHGVLSLELKNGFNGRQQDVADSLPWTCGSMLSAARAALNNGKVACSPTSGFHHAGVSTPYGYCTFNGLMVTALSLKAEGLVERVGILDLDQHYGDGTAEIIEAQQINWIHHVSQERWDRRDAAPFLATLPETVAVFKDCDLLLFQAGADPHVDDPLGGFLTTEELALRDAIVFQVAHDVGLPVAWNLAGGYQEPISKVLEIHLNTMKACVAEYLR